MRRTLLAGMVAILGLMPGTVSAQSDAAQQIADQIRHGFEYVSGVDASQSGAHAALAQGDAPRLLQTEDGAFWVLIGGQRWFVAPEPTTADALAAIPDANASNPVAAPAPAAISFSGKAYEKTRPFSLAAGNYTVRWMAKADNSIGSCYHGTSMKSATGTATHSLINIGPKDGKAETGETQLYRVAAGEWYFDIISGCVWEITISPQ